MWNSLKHTTCQFSEKIERGRKIISPQTSSGPQRQDFTQVQLMYAGFFPSYLKFSKPNSLSDVVYVLEKQIQLQNTEH